MANKSMMQKKSFQSLKNQVGATLLGMMFVGGMIVFVALIAMKMFPAYQEYFSVKTIIRAMKQEANNLNKNEIAASFDRRANVGYVTVITGKDLEVGKNAKGETTVTARYRVVTPLFGNVSVLMDFETSTDSKF